MLIDVCAVGSMPFPADKLAAVNKSVELPEGKHLLSLDDGKNYVAQFEVFHQLHCLVCEGLAPPQKAPRKQTRGWSIAGISLEIGILTRNPFVP